MQCVYKCVYKEIEIMHFVPLRTRKTPSLFAQKDIQTYNLIGGKSVKSEKLCKKILFIFFVCGIFL